MMRPGEEAEVIRSERLDLIPGTAGLLEAELVGVPSLREALEGIHVPDSWPPPLYDQPAARWALARLVEDPARERWGLRYFVLRDGGEGRPVLVGAGGYRGPPDADGSVEVGYSILPEFWRRGLATEAARALVEAAFREPRVRRVVAETLPDLLPSIGVLQKVGFRLAGPGSELGVVRYAIDRWPAEGFPG